MLRYLKSIWALIAPNLCLSCQLYHKPDKGVLCPSCVSTLSFTQTWRRPAKNELTDKFDNHEQINQGIALYYLDEDSVLQSVVYAIKYAGREDIAYDIGQSFGRRILEMDLFESVDMIIPIPLHKKKHHQRGYNQSHAIAEGIASELNKQINSKALRRIKNTQTQTDMSKEQRLINVQGAFELGDVTGLTDAHILLVDDVVTTGATCSACMAVLSEVPGLTFSIATIALPIDF